MNPRIQLTSLSPGPALARSPLAFTIGAALAVLGLARRRRSIER